MAKDLPARVARVPCSWAVPTDQSSRLRNSAEGRAPLRCCFRALERPLGHNGAQWNGGGGLCSADGLQGELEGWPSSMGTPEKD